MVKCGARGRRARGAGGRAALPALDRLNELALSHPAYPGDAHGLRHPLQFRQQHAGQPTARGRAPSPGACVTGAEVVAAAVPDRGSGGSDRLRGIPGQIPGTGEELGGFAHEGSFPELRRRLREPVDPVLQPGELTGPSCAPDAAWRRLEVLCARGVQTTLVPPKTRARTGPQSTPFSPEPRVLSHFFKAISRAYSGGGEEAVRRFADRESPTTADHTAGNAADDGRALAPTAGHLVQHPA